MKQYKTIIFAAFTIILLSLWSCERDDICAEDTPTTPRLIVEFFDSTSPDDLLNVPNFTVYGEGLVTDPTESSDATLVFNSSVNTIELPLFIDDDDVETTSRFIMEMDTNLRLDDDASTESNIDIIEITYTPEFVFVSRACGFKSIFNDLGFNVDEDADNWINSITVLETTVENEDIVHVNISH